MHDGVAADKGKDVLLNQYNLPFRLPTFITHMITPITLIFEQYNLPFRLSTFITHKNILYYLSNTIYYKSNTI